jgi:hypothetical protein
MAPANPRSDSPSDPAWRRRIREAIRQAIPHGAGASAKRFAKRSRMAPAQPAAAMDRREAGCRDGSP